jgi:ribA/ribD-fused uncharacterized protein
MDRITFNRLKDPYGEFSNFYPISIDIDSKEYKSSEHYYQSKKYEDTKWEDHVRSQEKPYEAAREGRRKDLPLREDWEDVKVLVMRRILIAKFKRIEYMRNLLLSTGNAEIVEYSDKDYFWGRGKDGAGYNMLGKLLMEMREEIKNEEERKEKFF